MPYFLSKNNLTIGQPSIMDGEEADHIVLSRRAKVGDELKAQGPDGKRFLAVIKEIKKHDVVIGPLKEILVPVEPQVKATLFQSAVASGTLDTILQKATELGAAEIVLFNSQHTATRLSAEKFRDKLPRFQKVLWEAAKQCERGQVPTLTFADNLEGVVKKSADLDQLFIFDISGEKLLTTPNSQLSTLGLVIGPEGGLSVEEIKTLSGLSNSKLATLGPLLLKADTAAIASLSVCQSLLI